RQDRGHPRPAGRQGARRAAQLSGTGPRPSPCDDHRMGARPTVLLLTGPPGTGKSTLAEGAAELMAAPVLRWDWAMAALRGFEPVQAGLRELTHAEHRRVGWTILWNLATAQLRRGCSVVLDGVAREPEVAGTREVARSAGARCLVVVTSC